MLLLRDFCAVQPARLRRGPQVERASALEDDEDLLFGGVAVRRRALLAGLERGPVEPGQLRPGTLGQGPSSPLVFGRGVLEVDDARRSLGRLADFGLARL